MIACTSELFDGYFIKEEDYAEAYQRAQMLLKNLENQELRSCEIIVGSASVADRQTTLGVVCPARIKAVKVSQKRGPKTGTDLFNEL